MEQFLQFLQRHKYDIIRAAAVLAVNIAVMLLLPAAVMSFAPADMGMMLCITLFFAVDPALSAAAGLYAGLDIRNRWFTAIFPTAVFLLSSGMIFGADAADFTVYAVIYAGITLVVMLFTFLVKRFSPSRD